MNGKSIFWFGETDFWKLDRYCVWLGGGIKQAVSFVLGVTKAIAYAKKSSTSSPPVAGQVL